MQELLIAPSILSADFAALGRDVEMICEAGADWVHVDVMDGHFVPNLTIGPNHVRALKKVTDTPLDVHLMVDNPQTQVPWYIEAGADSITFHYEAAEDPLPILRCIHERKVRCGLAINPDTPVEVLEPYMRYLDLVLVMSVFPGFGGQSFIEDTPGRVEQVVALCKEAGVLPTIEVDGGINASTVALVAKAGANMFVAGNAIFGADEPPVALAAIRAAAQVARSAG